MLVAITLMTTTTLVISIIRNEVEVTIEDTLEVELEEDHLSLHLTTFNVRSILSGATRQQNIITDSILLILLRLQLLLLLHLLQFFSSFFISSSG
jgi:hypothetical protein